MTFVLRLVFFAALLLGPRSAYALAEASGPSERNPAPSPGWKADITGSDLGPPLFLAINKVTQQLYVFEQKSPLSMSEQYVCSTGEKEGDKSEAGDMRTPEGVYFLEKRLDSGLDFDLYGKFAFTLNFPNPMDRLKSKKGSGIWIHGRGHVLTPRETRGCVALYNEDLSRLEPRLRPGLPVLIANSVSFASDAAKPDIAAELKGLVETWAKNWQSRSEQFFDFYEPEKFTWASDESFTSFKTHKQNLFKTLPWLHLLIDDIKVLPGPDYYVTYFNQYYRSPNLTSEGVQRLYWQRDSKGAFRIAGREWHSTSVDLEKRYLESLTPQMAALIESWRAAWEKGDLESYLSFYRPDASQGDRRGLESIRAHKKEIWKDAAAMKVGIDDLKIVAAPQGLAVSFDQYYQSGGKYQDKGHKTLILEPRGEGWKIASENWSGR